ncbi:heat shock 70 kDa protein 12A-like [Magallana gigas]|uniref:heat shock 70 kDa protein 12A-like n=1 Tax=Magallana gigas TaxID=29159 RepID=UPI00333E8DB1
MDTKFVAFGFEAESEYTNLLENGDGDDYFYFCHLKMMLYEHAKTKRLTRDTMIPDSRGRELPAVKVFSYAIKYLKDRLLDDLKKREDMELMKKEGVTSWLLTVPANWDDKAKEFMREAAKKAGIPLNQLSIALEPAAANIYCKHLKNMDGTNTITVFERGNKYLYLDAGGGTVEITALEVKKKGDIKELVRSNDWKLGSGNVDMAFKSLLAEIATEEMIEGYSKKCRKIAVPAPDSHRPSNVSEIQESDYGLNTYYGGRTLSNALLVAAIDLGSTFSGYAFAWRADAECKYAYLSENGEGDDYFYFPHFKMMLYGHVKTKGGISSSQLVIALEPEAATLYFRHVKALEDTNTIGVFKPGSKYLFLDAGGGTVDITVLEVKNNGDIKELHRSSDGESGGSSVDTVFKSVLAEISMKEMIENYRRKYPYDYLSLFENFENKKRRFQKGQAACDRIIKLLKTMFQSPKLIDVKKILMVGGFSESCIFQEALRDAFSNCQVVVPEEAGLAVLRGAVLLGFYSGTKPCRVSRHTYGVDKYG